MSARVLVVEDDPKIAALLRDYFAHADFTVEVIHRGDEADAAIARFAPQLLILDLQLPGRDGLDICRALRARGPDPAIIMLTARVDEIDRLIGLELGADDYICKPFSPREVVARARAVLRRLLPSAPGNGALVVGALQLDAAAHQARVAGELLTLTPIEFELLASFLSQPQRIWSRAQLLERVRGTDFSGYERNIDGHIKNLRRKLRDHLEGGDPIRSVYGVGYGLDAGALT
ncbi:response regulator transcription factor [Solimonas terrae]|uniref:Response regulator transcription factor n=1 Tax=Solimonas terrae TaxID=1396819 RepID=A0A6M2BNB1_9GAMM|nr:response regulator transcription factor [Solimonas terrae]NGY03523.1 response regulator transcription factor [Solimonas terrae]